MSKNRNDSVCAHYLSKYLPLTENWIYRILVNHVTYKPIILTRKRANLELFPISPIHSLDDFNSARKYAELIFFKLAGYFHFFATLCRRNSVQILHVHFGYQGVKLLGLKKRLKVPMICSFYGDDAFATRHTGKYKDLFIQADRILVLGEYMRAALIKQGCPENKIFIHHLGIDVQAVKFIKRKVQAGDRIRFLIASSFVEKKGIDLAINALAALKDRYKFSLDIIGDGPLKETLLKLIESSGIKDRIKLHGYKPYDYFIEMAYSCEVFIQASRTTEANNKEGTPMAIVDAMATGMAVASTRHSDIPEIVVDGETGYLAEENDLTGLVEVLERIFKDPGVIEKFSVKGRLRAEREFDAKIQTARLESYYAQLISTQKNLQ
jgi:colanic acid/amylovoran biosynthesis glycosyltransferase